MKSIQREKRIKTTTTKLRFLTPEQLGTQQWPGVYLFRKSSRQIDALWFFDQQQASTLHLLNQPWIVVGRDDDCHIVLDHQTVSRRHATIQQFSEHWQLRDLHSTNGTYVNGFRTQNHELHPGDLIRFASCFAMMVCVDRELQKGQPA